MFRNILCLKFSIIFSFFQMEEKIGPYGLDQFSIILFFVVCLQFSDSIFFSDGGKDRSVWLGSVHDISYLRGLRSLSCPRHCQPWDNWILYQSRSATFLFGYASVSSNDQVSQSVLQTFEYS